MKFFVLFGVALGLAAAAELYSSENDNIDIEGILSRSEEFKGLVDCFLDRGPCDAVAADFRKDLPEAVEQSCAKCTDAQKHLFNRFLGGLKEKSPQDHDAFKAKYDPENKYFGELEQAVANA
ncbi:Ejaculatory bulb-specific protein 3 [Eumeta japonica]|uniref:Ejaculatory bulb-specific protein 3 n=1 Tax=Eumeta variegata TaxID=151549 RepID=A0A4C1T2Z0_EUMVA|nr:Ejaculatory bulb-specific protein 3 [Eumeta japonica]